MDNRQTPVIKVKFSTKDCRPCVQRTQCIRSKKRYVRRTLTIRQEAQYRALQAARQREETGDFRQEYARRAGIEGTLARGIRTCGLRRSRYIGLARTHLAHLMTAAGINFLRLGEWFIQTGRAQTWQSPLVRLLRGATAM